MEFIFTQKLTIFRKETSLVIQKFKDRTRNGIIVVYCFTATDSGLCFLTLPPCPVSLKQHDSQQEGKVPRPSVSNPERRKGPSSIRL